VTLDALALGGRPLSDPAGSTDTAIDVHAALRTLVPEQRAALVLVDILGYPVADAAKVLGISQGTLKSRTARGRARLLPRLAHLRPGAPTNKTGGTNVLRETPPNDSRHLTGKEPTTGGRDAAAPRPAHRRHAALLRWHAAEASREARRDSDPRSPPR
jgi:predicted DNA-binding protein (UPF0251 family)